MVDSERKSTENTSERIHSPARKLDIFNRLGYTEIKDAVSNAEFNKLFADEFPRVLSGSRTENPAELDSAKRARVAVPECTTLQTQEGERLWALSFGDRFTVVVDAGEPRIKSDVDETTEGRVLPIRHMLIGQRNGDGNSSMIDLVDYLHTYERRKNVPPTELYLTLGYMDPYYFPGDSAENPYVLMPLALGAHKDKLFVDPDKTASVAIHEGAHAARRNIDARREKMAGGANTVTRQAAESGAHRVGRILAHRLGRHIDTHVYNRFMGKSLDSYRRGAANAGLTVKR